MKQDTIKKIGTLIGSAIIIIGLALSVGFFQYLLFILVVDAAAPSITSCTPAANGWVPVGWQTPTCTAVDATSGVANVVCVIDGTSYVLSLQTGGTKYSGTWSTTISAPSSGSHTVRWIVTDYAGNAYDSGSGSFEVYGSLAGTWYIGATALTSSSQTVYVTSGTVTFKFVKSGGTRTPTCTITKNSGPSVTLPTFSTSDSVTWTATGTFSDGMYDLTLKADDGRGNISLSIVGLQVGGIITLETYYVLLGIALMGFGIVVVAVSRKPELLKWKK